jgi:hypothetical protein
MESFTANDLTRFFPYSKGRGRQIGIMLSRIARDTKTVDRVPHLGGSAARYRIAKQAKGL